MNPSKLKTSFFRVKEESLEPKETIHCTVSIGSKMSAGRGESFSLELSKKKAFGEAIERLSLLEGLPFFETLGKPTNSNGIAFHFNKRKAQENSISELVERQQVFSGWLMENFVFRYNESFLEFSSTEINRLAKFLKNKFNCDLELLYFGCSFGRSVFSIVLKKQHPPYLVFGFGCNEKPEMAIEKAVLEASSIIQKYDEIQKIYNTQEQLIKNEFLKNILYYGENKKPIDQVFYCSDLSDYKPIEKGFTQPSYPEFRSTFCELSQFGLKGYLCRSTSPTFYDITGGSLSESKGKRLIGEFHPIG